MIMTVYPNGVGERKNMHVSVYMLVFFAVNLMLNFNGHSVALTVEAYNRTLEQWSNRTEIVLNSQECDLRVLSRKVNVLIDGKRGYQDFLPLAKFMNDYIILCENHQCS